MKTEKAIAAMLLFLPMSGCSWLERSLFEQDPTDVPVYHNGVLWYGPEEQHVEYFREPETGCEYVLTINNDGSTNVEPVLDEVGDKVCSGEE